MVKFHPCRALRRAVLAFMPGSWVSVCEAYPRIYDVVVIAEPDDLRRLSHKRGTYCRLVDALEEALPSATYNLIYSLILLTPAGVEASLRGGATHHDRIHRKCFLRWVYRTGRCMCHVR